VQFKKKERLYLHEILEEPLLSYPPYYTLTASMRNNEMLLDAIRALHSYDFDHYKTAESIDEVFKSLDAGVFVIYKTKYIVGYFGGKLMFLEPQGWKSLPATREIFLPDNWLV